MANPFAALAPATPAPDAAPEQTPNPFAALKAVGTSDKPAANPFADLRAIDPSADKPPQRMDGQFDAKIRKYALQEGIDPETFRALIQTESSFDPHAVNKSGAMGLGQLMPATVKAMGVKDPFDPDQNLQAAARYLKDTLGRYAHYGDNAMKAALAEYNGGLSQAEMAGKGQEPSYPETRAYLKNVLGLTQENRTFTDTLAKVSQDKADQLRRGGMAQQAAATRAKTSQLPTPKNNNDPLAWTTPIENHISSAVSGSFSFLSDAALNAAFGPYGAKAYKATGVDSKLQPALRTTINALETPFEAMNFLLRSANGGDPKFQQIWSNPKLSFTDKLDALANEYGFNSPGELQYWSGQPGVVDALHGMPKSPLGGIDKQADISRAVVAATLGLHADFARIKANHPLLAGVETLVAEFRNPGYLAPGAIARGVRGVAKAAAESGPARAGAKAAQDVHADAAAGKYGPLAQKAATGAESVAKTVRTKAAAAGDWLHNEAPITGNRYGRMETKYGDEGGYIHQQLVTVPANRVHQAREAYSAPEMFGQRPFEDQVTLMGQVEKVQGVAPERAESAGIENPENAAQPLPQAKVAQSKEIAARSFSGNPTPLEEAARKIAARMDQNDLDLLNADPKMAKVMMLGGLTGEGLRYVPRVSGGEHLFNDLIERDIEPGAGSSTAQGTRSPVNATHRSDPRSIDDIMGGAARGGVARRETTPREVNQGFAPVEAFTKSEARKLGYVERLRSVMSTSALTDEHGHSLLTDVPWKDVLPAINLTEHAISVAKKPTESAFETVERLVAAQAPKLGIAEREAWNAMDNKLRETMPNHTLLAHQDVGMPKLEGKAVSRDVVEMVHDVVPGLREIPEDSPNFYQERTKAQAEHVEEMDPAQAFLENVGAIARFAILGGGIASWWHPVINIAPVAAKLGADPRRLFQAFFGGMDPALLRAVPEEAKEPLFGDMFKYGSPRAFNRISSELGKTWPEKLMKVMVNGSKASQDLVFGYWGQRIVAVTYDSLIKQGYTKARAVRTIRREFGDFGNLTKGEQNKALRALSVFYAWAKTRLRAGAADLTQQPRFIGAPLEAVRMANAQQGDAGDITGLHLRMGEDADGNPIQVSLPFGAVRYGAEMASAAGSLASGNLAESMTTLAKMAASHVHPFARVAVAALDNNLGTDKPGGMLDASQDLGHNMLSMAEFLGGTLVPGQAKSMLAAGQHKDARLLTPGAYSQDKFGGLFYARDQELRSILKKYPNISDNARDEIRSTIRGLGRHDMKAGEEADEWIKMFRGAAPKQARPF